MALDIIKEQRMIRALFYSLVQSAELINTNKEQSEKFVAQVSKFIRERALAVEGTQDTKEVVVELLETFGWKSIKIDYTSGSGSGKISLGKNRYFINEISDSDGSLLVLRAFFEGICYYLMGAPAEAKVTLSFSSGTYYEIDFSKKKGIIVPIKKVITAVPEELTDRSIHESLTINSVFNPIFTKEIPSVILFETAWKVITESYIANYAIENDEIAKEALKIPSMENLSIIILKLTEQISEEEIMSMADIVGEFFVRILSTKISSPLFEKLQSTLRDKHATSYLIYYECRLFCADKQFVNRCTFIRGMWVGILSELYGQPIKVIELMHAGKRDTYCMVELGPK